MIVDLIDKLINRSIDLIHETEKRNRDVFNDFVEPLFQSFETVHKDYMDTFKKVHEFIVSNNSNNYGEIGLILQDDSLFTMSNRLKLISLSKSHKPKIIKEFVDGIENYLNGSFYLIYGEEGKFIDEYLIKFINMGEVRFFQGPNSNQARSALWQRIERNSYSLSPKKKKKEYLMTVGQFLQEFQEGYAIVVSEYGKLKNELLNNEL